MAKKIIRGVVLVLVVVAALAPLITSFKVEKEYNTTLQQLNTYYAGQVIFKGTFNRGYLSSTAKTQIIPAGAPADAANDSIELTHTILNGPVILDFRGWLNPHSYVPQGYKLAVINTVLDGDFNKALEAVYKNKPAYTITSEFAYNGSGVTHIINYPVTKEIGLGAVQWKGFDLIINHSKYFANINSTLSMPSLSYTEATQNAAPKKSASITNVNMAVTGGSAALEDTFDFTIANFIISVADTTISSLEKFDVNVHSKKSKTLIDSDITVAFNKFTIGSDVYGPLQMTTKLGNVDFKMLETLSDEAKENVHMAPQAHFEKVLHSKQMLGMLAARPSAEVDLKLQLPNGKVDITGNLSVGGKDLTSISRHTLFATSTGSTLIQVDQTIVYEILAKYLENLIQAKEREFFMTNKDQVLKNPYTLTAAQRQPIVESWVITLMDKLRAEKIISENNSIVSINAKVDKGVLLINGQARSRSDLEKLQPYFDIKLNAVVPPPPPPSKTTGSPGAAGADATGSTTVTSVIVPPSEYGAGVPTGDEIRVVPAVTSTGTATKANTKTKTPGGQKTATPQGTPARQAPKPNNKQSPSNDYNSSQLFGGGDRSNTTNNNPNNNPTNNQNNVTTGTELFGVGR